MTEGRYSDGAKMQVRANIGYAVKVGRILRFRNSRLRVDDVGPPVRFWPKTKPRSGIRRLLFGARPFVLAMVLLLIWPTLDPALVEPPAFLSTDPERVDAHFTRCGPGRGHACVIDGDTFKLGQRKVRIIGIDAPEVHARCPAEARLAEQATAKLQGLLNQGAFEMVGRVGDMTDRYGRDLRLVRRKRADGGVQSIAEDMRESGLARRYLGGFRGGWC
jgi:endonuclease YncB( thermonuclease family)